jgi:hypothetical protein
MCTPRLLAITFISGAILSCPVPPAELTRAESTVAEIFKDDFAKHDDASRAALAKKLLKESSDESNDTATRYVLMRDAGDTALAAHDGAIE